MKANVLGLWVRLSVWLVMGAPRASCGVWFDGPASRAAHPGWAGAVAREEERAGGVIRRGTLRAAYVVGLGTRA
ncbi:hypothetical protein GCM10027039_38400 [Terrabacter koreensis]